MKILVLCPMLEEYRNFKRSMPSKTNNEYKVVCCGVGKAAAAASTALELVNSNYNLVAVIGYAAGYGFSLGDVILPDRARYHDVIVPEELVPELTKEYSLEGADPYPILTGDSFITKDNYAQLLSLYPRSRVLFDMEATAIAQTVEEYSPDTNLMVLKMVSDLPAKDTSFSEFVSTHTDFSQFVYYLETLQ